MFSISRTVFADLFAYVYSTESLLQQPWTRILTRTRRRRLQRALLALMLPHPVGAHALVALPLVVREEEVATVALTDVGHPRLLPKGPLMRQSYVHVCRRLVNH